MGLEKFSLAGKRVLVTGGNRGIGRAIAERFVADGYRVAVTARSGEGPEGALTVRADVTDATSLDAAFTEVEQTLGPVTIVVARRRRRATTSSASWPSTASPRS